MEPRAVTTIGRLAPPRGRRPKTVDRERRCTHPGCLTRLTRYNRGDSCYAHQSPRRVRVRGVPEEMLPTDDRRRRR